MTNVTNITNIGAQRAGFTIVDLLTTIVSIAIVLAVALPGIAGVSGLSGLAVSSNNLSTLGVVHAVYAADWNGRQFTAVVDDISTYGNSAQQAFPAYAVACPTPGSSYGACWHEPLILGWGFNEGTGQVVFYQYFQSPGNTGNNGLVVPIRFPDESMFGRGLGSFRIPNNRALHNYVGGHFYDPVFYAPNDFVAYDTAAPGFESPYEYPDIVQPVVGMGDLPAWSSYILSPAAMFHPDVMRHPASGGWQSPWSIDHGFTAPGQYAAVYAHLKTQMIEHHWNQNAPKDVCNPLIEYSVFDGCEPYYFNHAIESEPLALFYDGSLRLLPNVEVLAADAQVSAGTGYGLWSRDTPFGDAGYFGEHGFDLFSLSHHILTTDGIDGRDTIEGFAGLQSTLAPSWRGSGTVLRAGNAPSPASDSSAVMPEDGGGLFDFTPDS